MPFARGETVTTSKVKFAARIPLLLVCASGQAQALSDVSVSLSADGSAYYVGEPIRLSLTVRNDSDRPVSGYFHLIPANESTRILVRRSGQSFGELDFWKPDAQTEKLLQRVDYVRLPAMLAAKQESRNEMNLITLPRSAALALDAPGDYEIYVECTLKLEGQETSLRSGVVRVRIAVPHAEQQQALSEYLGKGLPTLLAYWPFAAPLSPQLTADADAFLDHHPSGAYSDHVRKAFVRALRQHIQQKRASPKDVDIYDKLKNTVPEDHPDLDPEGTLKRAREILDKRSKGSN
jgi:hypothetical protein